jgi:hypothetical protein
MGILSYEVLNAVERCHGEVASLSDMDDSRNWNPSVPFLVEPFKIIRVLKDL